MTNVTSLLLLGSLLLQLSCAGTNAELASQSDAFVNSIGVGVNFSITDPTSPHSNLPNLEAKINQMGIRHGRTGGSLSFISNGTYTRMQQVNAATGMTFDLDFDPRNLTATQANVEAVVNSLGVALTESIEGPNEFDLSGQSPWPTIATTYQVNLYSAVKTDANPQIAAIPVISFSVGNQGSASLAGDQSAQINNGNMHSYAGAAAPGTPGVISGYIGNAYLMDVAQKPIISTETGYTTCANTTGSISLTAHGKYIPREYLEQYNAGIPKTFIYNIADDFPDPTCGSTQLHFGLLLSDGTPKPGFTYMANLLPILIDRGPAFTPGNLFYLLSGSIAKIHHTLLQKRNGTFELILWIETSSYNTSTNTDIVVPPQTVSVGNLSGFTRANIYDPSISSAAQSSPSPGGGSISVTVKDSPIVLELIR